MIDRLAAHFSRYSLANLAVTVASIVSFPIMTRIFSVSDYGMMSLIGLAITIAAALGKLGLQHAALRFYSEVRAGLSRFTMAQYEATVVFGLLASGALAGLVWFGVGQAIRVWSPESGLAGSLVAATAGIVALQCINSAFVNQLRAREMSGVLSIYTVVRRYFDLALILSVLLLLNRTLPGFYLAVFTADLVATVALAAWFLKRHPIRFADLTPALWLPMLVYGLPLIVTELSSVMLALGDRFIIQSLLGPAAVGIYAAAYNLCDYISSVLVLAFTGAVQPMVLRLWADKGQAETEAFLGHVTHLYALFALPLAVGVAAVGEPMIAVFASAKFVPGAVVIPWVIAGLVLQGLFPVAAAGLYIRKQSGRVLAAILAAALANVVLNVLLIPVWGIAGAGMATTASYALMLILARLLGRGSVRIPLDIGRLARFVVAAALMFGVVSLIRFDSMPATLALRVLAGALAYPLVLLAIDRPSRRMASGVFGKLGLAGATR